MDELTEFQKDCGALLELAQEIAVKHGKYISCTTYGDGSGWVDSNGGRNVCTIGYREPANKTVFE